MSRPNDLAGIRDTGGGWPLELPRSGDDPVSFAIDFLEPGIFREYDLRHPNLERWTKLRQSLHLRQEARRQQGRFRKNPTAYLAALEAMLLKPSLLS